MEHENILVKDLIETIKDSYEQLKDLGYEFDDCPICQQKMPVEYKHSLTTIMIRGLSHLFQATGRRANLQKLLENKSEYTNFQKLRYFGLAMPADDDSGDWFMTLRGFEFMTGQRKVPKFVWTKKAKVIRFSNEMVSIDDIKDCVQYKQEWRAQAQFATGKQQNLF